jgi:hypothetical protein
MKSTSKISDGKSNIILHVDFNKHFPEPTGTNEGTVCYIIVVSKSLLVYKLAKNRITDKFNKITVFIEPSSIKIVVTLTIC